MARQSTGPLVKALRERPQPPRDGHWATFVRNHDELTLDKLPEDERQEVLDAGDPTVFAHRADCGGGTVIAVHNFADREVTVRIPADGVLTDLFTGGDVKPAKSGAKVDPAPCDYRWYRLVTE